jgi:hypothetical protein
MDDLIAELRRQIRAEQQRADESKRHPEQIRQRIEEAEEKLRSTTLPEYIEHCHEFIFQRFEVETSQTLTSKGPVASPKDQWLPAKLLPWVDFLYQQKGIFERLHSTFPDDKRAFMNKSRICEYGDWVARKKVANEKQLERVLDHLVEQPVSSIIEQLVKEDAAKDEFKLGRGIEFDNDAKEMGDMGEEPLWRHGGPNVNQLRADQVCVYKKGLADPGLRTLALVIEYKAPHKLPLPHLRLGLREMDIQEEVVNRVTKPTDKQEHFQYNADRLAAAAVTHIYHYMIEGGLEYSCLTTGEAFVFFKIDWNNPDILLFHLADPRAEVEANPSDARYCTAVSQVLAFTLLAMSAQPHGQVKRYHAIDGSRKWAVDYGEILRQMPESERNQSPPPSAFVPRTYDSFIRSPFMTQRQVGTLSTCGPLSDDFRGGQSPDRFDDDARRSLPKSTSPQRSNHIQGGQQDSSSLQVAASQGSAGHSQGRQYCTQKCLRGLVRGEALDLGCPNVRLHDPHCRHHPLDHASWVLSLHQQLDNSLDDGVVPLGIQGARGVAFQVTLLALGYTFFAKATVPEFVMDLNHETSLYQKLEPLQGLSIPVLLGTIDLKRPYYYDVRVRLVHMVFLSWCGEPIDRDSPPPASLLDIQEELVAHTRKLHALGVVHRDIRRQNVLWCSEIGGPMLIDFDRSEVLEPLRPPRVEALRGQRRLDNDPHRMRQSPRKLAAKGGRELVSVNSPGGLRRQRQNLSLYTDARKSLLREDISAAFWALRI